MNSPSCTIVRLTPPGRGAVASFLLCGEHAIDIFLQHWQRKVPNEHPALGRLQLTDDGDCEEAVVHRTAVDSLEMHVHGGEQVAAAIETLFQQHGMVCKTWQEHFAAGNSQQDLALRLLPFAPTERTAQILLDQYNGAYDREIAAIKQLPREEQQQRQTRLAQLAPLGKHLVEPFRVVLAGASNAGKSTLLNTILGFQRSIVHSTPGTTRDVVSGQTALDGFPVTFWDTAGFRETGDALEQRGIDRSMQSLTDADLVVWVIDPTVEEAKRPVCPVESNILFCWNKRDLETADGRRQTAADASVVGEKTSALFSGDKAADSLLPSAVCRLPSYYVSALTGEGIDELLNVIICRLVPTPPKPGEAVPL